jgi:hypothetical protein
MKLDHRMCGQLRLRQTAFLRWAGIFSKDMRKDLIDLGLLRSIGEPGLANGGLFAQGRAAPRFAGLFIVFSFPQFLGHAAPLEEFFETPQRRPNWFPVVHPHP